MSTITVVNYCKFYPVYCNWISCICDLDLLGQVLVKQSLNLELDYFNDALSYTLENINWRIMSLIWTGTFTFSMWSPTHPISQSVQVHWKAYYNGLFGFERYENSLLILISSDSSKNGPWHKALLKVVNKPWSNWEPWSHLTFTVVSKFEISFFFTDPKFTVWYNGSHVICTLKRNLV